jgi:hypothetical protein
MLMGDPGFVGGGSEIENCVAANGGRGETGDEGEERLPLDGDKVGMFNGRRDGIEQGHGQPLF